ncbi:hypothetical protein H6763_00345 [Candidatus Nomurabacteria bacterium]|nr:hypothetical protein [Candidatus Nomurabacteria bacterium]
MTPIVSYKEFIKNARNKKQAREFLKAHILRTGGNISQSAHTLKCSWRTIKKLLEADDLDYESKKAPKTIPHKIPQSTEELIEEYHKESGYGPDMLKLNYKIPHSTSTIWRVLSEKGLIRQGERTYVKKKKNSHIKWKLKAFEKWQLDTKYLDDIPNLIGPIQQGFLPRYEYTLRDMTTGTTFLGYGLKERSVYCTCSFVALAMYHMQLHGIDTHYVTIQSDNGPEIIGGINKSGNYSIEDIVEGQFGARFKTIPIRKPTFNSHVESFHGRIEYELYERMNICSDTNFVKEARDFELHWNTRRKTLGRKKTPECIARESGFLLSECFYNFPVLIFDIIPHKESMHYLPDDLIGYIFS